MSVSWNNNLGGWQVNGKGFYATEADAKAADGAAPSVATGNTYEEDDFATAFTAQPNAAVKAPAPRATSPDGLTYLDDGSYTPLYYNRQRAMDDPTFQYLDTAFVPQRGDTQYKFDAVKGIYYTEDNHGRRTYVGNDPAKQSAAMNTPIYTYNPTAAPAHNLGKTAAGVGGGALSGAALGGPIGAVAGGVAGGLATLPQASGGGAFLSAGDGSVGGRQGNEAEAAAANERYATTGSSAAPPGTAGATGAATGGAVAPPTGTRENAANDRTNDAGDMAVGVIDQNRAENDNVWADARARYDAVGPADYALSDEARSYQREGLQQQRELLSTLLGFDPNQYAAQFGDQALARSVALGRSQGGGYAAQQAGMFAAQEQAPALYAEGARQASALENQRLGAAQAVTKSFGDLGTMTRGQDETRAQFDAELPLEIANSVATLTQGQVALNQQESQMFADMWLDFAQLQSVYAGMDSDEQIAWWQNEAQKRGQDKQFQGIMASLKANGAISSKDLVGGLFQLGGGLIGAGGSIGAAYVGRK